MRGASTHGVQWFPEYINKGAMQTLRDEWGVNLLRMACYVTQYNGYTNGGQSLIDSKIVEGVQAAKELGMYVIVDWHIHEENPHTTKTVAEQFFKKYATLYKDYDNVIFEICNEPTGVQWYTGGNDLYSYCKDIAGIIRDCGSKALIVCGTNNWSQDVEDVAKKPLKDDGFEDIMYTFHFYSGTHYEDKRQKVRTAVAAGTPIFVTEFGICDASGNGGYDTANADEWIEFLDSMNISYACWSFCNKGESASYLKTSCNKTTGGFEESDLTTTGIWLVNTYRAHQDAENNEDTQRTPAPGTSSEPSSSAAPGTSGNPFVTSAPGTSNGPSVTAAPGASGQPSVSNPPVPTASNTPNQPQNTTKPGTTNQPSSTKVPSGTSSAGNNTSGVGNSGQSGTGFDNGSLNNGGTNGKYVILKKKVLKIKKGRKAKIVIRRKMSKDRVKKYKIIKGKKYICVSKKGVVKGRRKGKAVVKVVMKSGASAKCRIVVR